jgi:hypothetical protein
MACAVYAAADMFSEQHKPSKQHPCETHSCAIAHMCGVKPVHLEYRLNTRIMFLCQEVKKLQAKHNMLQKTAGMSLDRLLADTNVCLYVVLQGNLNSTPLPFTSIVCFTEVVQCHLWQMRMRLMVMQICPIDVCHR